MSKSSKYGQRSKTKLRKMLDKAVRDEIDEYVELCGDWELEERARIEDEQHDSAMLAEINAPDDDWYDDYEDWVEAYEECGDEDFYDYWWDSMFDDDEFPETRADRGQVGDYFKDESGIYYQRVRVCGIVVFVNSLTGEQAKSVMRLEKVG